MLLKMNFTDGIDYDMVWGKVNYGLPQPGKLDINFDGLHKIIKDNDVLSIYNPTIAPQYDRKHRGSHQPGSENEHIKFQDRKISQPNRYQFLHEACC